VGILSTKRGVARDRLPKGQLAFPVLKIVLKTAANVYNPAQAGVLNRFRNPVTATALTGFLANKTNFLTIPPIAF